MGLGNILKDLKDDLFTYRTVKVRGRGRTFRGLSLSLSLFGRFDSPKDLDGSSVLSSRFFSTAPSRTDEGKCSSCSRVSAHRFDAISFSLFLSFSLSLSLSLSLWVKC